MSPWEKNKELRDKWPGSFCVAYMSEYADAKTRRKYPATKKLDHY